jgi:hypothetical protein
MLYAKVEKTFFLSRGSLFPEKRSFEGNKEARLKIVFSSVVYIFFFHY